MLMRDAQIKRRWNSEDGEGTKADHENAEGIAYADVRLIAQLGQFIAILNKNTGQLDLMCKLFDIAPIPVFCWRHNGKSVTDVWSPLGHAVYKTAKKDLKLYAAGGQTAQ